MVLDNSNIWMHYETSILVESKLIFPEYGSNKLISYDLEKNLTTCICTFWDEQEWGYRLFGDIVQWDKYVFLIPLFASCMYKVNLYTHEVTAIKDVHGQSLSAYVYKNTIFIIEFIEAKIIEYDCLSGAIRTSLLDSYAIMEKSKRADGGFFRKAKMEEKRLFIPCCRYNGLIIIDLDERKIDNIELGGEQCGFSDVCCIGDNIWLVSRSNGMIYIYNKRTKKTKQLDLQMKTGNFSGYLEIVKYGRYVYPIPICYDHYIYRININTFSNSSTKIRGGSKATMIGDSLFFMSFIDGKICDEKMEVCKKIPIYECADFNKYLDHLKQKCSLLYNRRINANTPSCIYYIEDYSEALNDYLYIVGNLKN